eukprot:tig00000145_g8816.t1
MPGKWRGVRAEGERTPCERRGHSATAAGSRIVIFGGNDHDVFFDDLYVLELAPERTPRWIHVANSPVEMAPSPRRGHSATLVGNKIIVFGGVGPDAQLHNDLHILDLDSLTWSLPTGVGGAPPTGRYGHTATLVGNKIVIFGGSGDAVYNDLHVLDLRRMAWYEAQCSGKPPSPRCGHTASLVGRRLVVFGGGGQEDCEARFFSDTHLLDTDSMAWSVAELGPGSGPPPSPRRAHTATAVAGRVLVFGGGGGEAGGDLYNDLHLFDLDGMRWSLVPDPEGDVPEPRLNHTAAACGGELVVFAGGRKDGGRSYNSLFALDLLSLTECIRAPPGCPPFDAVVRARDGTELGAHRAVLAAGCGVFASMLSSGMREARAGVLELDESGPVAAALLRFLYAGGAAGPAPAALAPDLLRLSDLYQLDRLAWRAPPRPAPPRPAAPPSPGLNAPPPLRASAAHPRELYANVSARRGLDAWSATPLLRAALALDAADDLADLALRAVLENVQAVFAQESFAQLAASGELEPLLAAAPPRAFVLAAILLHRLRPGPSGARGGGSRTPTASASASPRPAPARAASPAAPALAPPRPRPASARRPARSPPPRPPLPSAPTNSGRPRAPSRPGPPATSRAPRGRRRAPAMTGPGPGYKLKLELERPAAS